MQGSLGLRIYGEESGFRIFIVSGITDSKAKDYVPPSLLESLSELRNKTSRIGDAVKSLEAKVENLIALINRTSFIPQPVPIPTGNLKRKVLIQLLIFNL